jgi:hypothetical protein
MRLTLSCGACILNAAKQFAFSQEGQQGEKKFEIPDNVKDINGTLHFSNVTAEDKGRYMCVATNSQGIINATIDIDVIGTCLSSYMFLSPLANT